MPDVKLIYIMRDPVDRAWSLIRYHESRDKLPRTDLPIDKLRELAFHTAIVEQSNYETILKRWQREFSPEQLFLAYYDEITEDPEDLLLRMCSFLGIDPSKYPTNRDENRKRINQSLVKDIPAQLEKELIEHYLPMVARLSESRGGYYSKWLEGYQSLIT